MAKKRAKLVPVQDGRPGYYVELDNSEICDGGGSGLEVIDFGILDGWTSGGFEASAGRNLTKEECDKISEIFSKHSTFVARAYARFNEGQGGFMELIAPLTYMNMSGTDISYGYILFTGDVLLNFSVSGFETYDADNSTVQIQMHAISG